MRKRINALLGWTKAHPGETIVIVVLTVVVVTLAVLLLPKVLGSVLAVAFMAWLFYDSRPKPQIMQIPPCTAESLLMDLLFEVLTLRNLAGLFSVVAPEVPGEMDCGSCWKGPMEVFQAMVLTVPNATPNCAKIKPLLQQKLNAVCGERRLPNLFTVVEVQDTATGGLIIQAAYLGDDEHQRQYQTFLAQKNQQRRNELTTGAQTPSDDEF